MVTTNNTLTPITAAVQAALGDPPAGGTPPDYKQLATDLIKAIDALTAAIPQFNIPHALDQSFLRTFGTIPVPFLSTMVDSVEQNEELQGIRKLDVARAQDMLRFLAAFRPVVNKVSDFLKSLRSTMTWRKAEVAQEALQVYAIAKGIALGKSSASVALLVENMKRDFRGTKKAKPQEVPNASPGIAK